MPEPKIHYEPVKAYVPVNLPDIDHLNLPGSNVGLNPDRIRAIYHLLYMLRGKGAANDKYNSTDSFKQGWINVSSTLLTKVGTRSYSVYLNWMEANGLLEIRRDQTTGQKKYSRNLYSIQYRIPQRLLYNPNGIRHYKKQTITDHCTLKAIYNLRDSFIKPDTSVLFQPLPIHYTMFDMLKEFCFDIEKAELYLTRVASGELEGKHTKSGSERDLSALMLNMEAFNDGNFSFTCDAFGERFHTPVTNLWKGARKFLALKSNMSEKLACLDFSNSQPYFASICALPRFTRAVLPEFEPCLRSQSTYMDTVDFVSFTGFCARGEIYEKWAQERGISREDAKQELFYILFAKNKPMKNVPGLLGAPLAFKGRFPGVSFCFRSIKNTNENTLPFIKELFLNRYGRFIGKGSYYKALSSMMQRSESRMVLKIAQRMLDENIRPFITIHDSWILPWHHMNRAKEIIQEAFLELGVLPPAVKTEFL